jgi:hypothetical protein
MFYKLLGYIVWNGFKLFLRQRYGSTVVSKPVAAGAAAATAGGVALAVLAAKRNDSTE